jgi:hypothetical protein
LAGNPQQREFGPARQTPPKTKYSYLTKGTLTVKEHGILIKDKLTEK